ncbi:MAG: type II toxin-antitoxin system PemK/MazF family toxin [Acidobacteria bacterium]|nr:type II toxin-antitoxin system PemK/MazF family toxin [Acidobacteriota bacterium]
MGTPKPLIPKRGEVYLVSFDPTLGAEIQKTRPALILQNDIGNQHSPLTIVAAVTSNVLRRGPTGVLVHAPEAGLAVDSVVLLNQIRTIDKSRLGKRLGVLRSATMKQVDQAIMISLALIDI